MSSIPRELNSIDFSQVLGAPLIAGVEASAEAARSTVSFISEVGFHSNENGDKSPVMVDFEMDKPVEVKDGEGNTVIQQKKVKIRVPYLTLINIPNLHMDNLEVDFNAKINSIQERKTSSSHNLGGSLSASAGWGFGSAKVKVSYSYKRSNESKGSTNKTYSLSVKARMTQAEQPVGQERILSMLENIIEEAPVE